MPVFVLNVREEVLMDQILEVHFRLWQLLHPLQSTFLESAFLCGEKLLNRPVHNFFNLVNDLVEDIGGAPRIHDHLKEWLEGSNHFVSVRPHLKNDQITDALLPDVLVFIAAVSATLRLFLHFTDDEVVIKVLLSP